VLALLGDAAEAVAASPVSYPPLDRVDAIQQALASGRVCRVQGPGVRLLIYRHEDSVRAVATELAHAHYRRRYRSYEAATVGDLVACLRNAYAAQG
jgi:hypothetical protein